MSLHRGLALATPGRHRHSAWHNKLLGPHKHSHALASSSSFRSSALHVCCQPTTGDHTQNPQALTENPKAHRAGLNSRVPVRPAYLPGMAVGGAAARDVTAKNRDGLLILLHVHEGAHNLGTAVVDGGACRRSTWGGEDSCVSHLWGDRQPSIGGEENVAHASRMHDAQQHIQTQKRWRTDNSITPERTDVSLSLPASFWPPTTTCNIARMDDTYQHRIDR